MRLDHDEAVTEPHQRRRALSDVSGVCPECGIEMSWTP